LADQHKVMTANEAWLQAIQRTAALAKRPERTLSVVVREMAERTPEALAILSAEQRFSYRTLSQRAARYAAWARAQALGKGDVVALMMANRPEYVALWLGVTQTGATVALLNTQLSGAALAHCIAAAGARTVIVDAGLVDRLPLQGLKLWVHGDAPGSHPRIDAFLDGHVSSGGVAASNVTLADRALYIYTSGTTGLPKAASVSHHRILQWAEWFAGMGDLTAADRTYNCLPLYHSVGGVVAVGAALAAGGSVFVRDGFSARRFWSEVAEQDCTVFQYIGELCRYLLNSPTDPASARHGLRLATGNGLKGDIWQPFKERFAIPQILEFYAATEGSFSLFNYEQQPGAVGRIPGFVSQNKTIALVQVDGETGTPLRAADGRCVRCGPDQPGEVVSKLTDDAARASEKFEGYADAAATEAKILRGVFAAGDAWYRSGDLMRKDAKGFFYFVDRIGDTFRWKGENVSTAEVTDVLRSCPGVIDADVYGVAVPGADGKAGMAALVTERWFDLAAFRAHVGERLPAYARPLFVRLRTSLERTSTFKSNKQQLMRDGFDPALTDDPVHVDVGGYVRVDAEVMLSIVERRVRF
jgi:fatty-acyl-CoA synthase